MFRDQWLRTLNSQHHHTNHPSTSTYLLPLPLYLTLLLILPPPRSAPSSSYSPLSLPLPLYLSSSAPQTSSYLYLSPASLRSDLLLLLLLLLLLSLSLPLYLSPPPLRRPPPISTSLPLRSAPTTSSSSSLYLSLSLSPAPLRRHSHLSTSPSLPLRFAQYLIRSTPLRSADTPFSTSTSTSTSLPPIVLASIRSRSEGGVSPETISPPPPPLLPLPPPPPLLPLPPPPPLLPLPPPPPLCVSRYLISLELDPIQRPATFDFDHLSHLHQRNAMRRGEHTGGDFVKGEYHVQLHKNCHADKECQTSSMGIELWISFPNMVDAGEPFPHTDAYNETDYFHSEVSKVKGGWGFWKCTTSVAGL